MRLFNWLARVQGKDREEVVAEWHAFVQGFSEAFCPWPARWKVPSPHLLEEIMDEHHYYVFGRAVGFSALATLITALIRWIL